MVGVPLVIGVIAWSVYQSNQKQARRRARALSEPDPVGEGGAGPVVPVREQLLKVDTGFSEPLFIDFFQRIFATARQLGPTGDTATLRPWMTPAALAELQSSSPATVEEVIFGATRLTRCLAGTERTSVEVFTELNLIGTDAQGRRVHLLRHESWTLGRRSGVQSPGPDRMRVLCCASCGDTTEPGVNGACTACGNPRTGGETQWEVDTVRVTHSRPLPAVEVHPGGGREPGLELATRTAPDLAVQKRAMINRHPSFSWVDFEARVRHVFLAMQTAWMNRRLEDARAHQTDALFQVHRFWMARYVKSGLVNRMSEVAVSRVEVAKVTRDAWFESVTVRIFAQMNDWTERLSDGKVVGGSRTEARIFSEYWTFVRTVGAAGKGVKHTLDECPSCGAPLDRVSEAGVCGYCESKISGGDFDWVVSRIEQDEAWRG